MKQTNTLFREKINYFTYYTCDRRNLLLVLKKWGAVNFIVWCDAACTVRVLDAAQRVGLLAERHSYLLPALDMHTRDLADYSYGGANITSIVSNSFVSYTSSVHTTWLRPHHSQSSARIMPQLHF